MPRIKNYFPSQIREIELSPSLRWFGFMLGLSHILTFAFWTRSATFGHIIADWPLRLCWPFLPSCGGEGPGVGVMAAVLTVYLGLGLGTCLAFIYGRIWPGYFLLLGASAVKVGVYLADYRFMGNYHYMHYWLLFLYLFWPAKKQALPLIIVGFYLGAGLLKFNREWISGAALFNEPLFRGKFLEAACLYVVVLENAFTVGLLSNSARVFTAVLVQLALFHIYSYFVVGFYYPLLMLSFLALFVLLRRHGEWDRRRMFSPLILAPFLVFVAAQVAPRLLSSRPDLTGIGRLYSLNMLDSDPVCETFYLARYAGRSAELSPLYSGLGVRLRCDVEVALAGGREYCRRLRAEPEFKNLDLALVSRRFTDDRFIKVLERKNFCSGGTP